mgnify:CR=1 FL=1
MLCVEHGHKVPAVNLWVKGEPAARLSFETYRLRSRRLIPSCRSSRRTSTSGLLIERLEQLGVSVERRTELVSFTDEGESGDCPPPRTRGSGREPARRTTSLAATARTQLVRDTIGTGFPGGTYRQVFYVADVEAAGPSAERRTARRSRRGRLPGRLPVGRRRPSPSHRNRARTSAPTTPRRSNSRTSAIGRSIHLKVDVQKVNWFSTYHVHHRVAEHFRKGRAFLLGDAAPYPQPRRRARA